MITDNEPLPTQVEDGGSSEDVLPSKICHEKTFLTDLNKLQLSKHDSSTKDMKDQASVLRTIEPVARMTQMDENISPTHDKETYKHLSSDASSETPNTEKIMFPDGDILVKNKTEFESMTENTTNIQVKHDKELNQKGGKKSLKDLTKKIIPSKTKLSKDQGQSLEDSSSFTETPPLESINTKDSPVRETLAETRMLDKRTETKDTQIFSKAIQHSYKDSSPDETQIVIDISARQDVSSEANMSPIYKGMVHPDNLGDSQRETFMIDQQNVDAVKTTLKAAEGEHVNTMGENITKKEPIPETVSLVVCLKEQPDTSETADFIVDKSIQQKQTLSQKTSWAIQSESPLNQDLPPEQVKLDQKEIQTFTEPGQMSVAPQQILLPKCFNNETDDIGLECRETRITDDNKTREKKASEAPSQIIQQLKGTRHKSGDKLVAQNTKQAAKETQQSYKSEIENGSIFIEKKCKVPVMLLEVDESSVEKVSPKDLSEMKFPQTSDDSAVLKKLDLPQEKRVEKPEGLKYKADDNKAVSILSQPDIKAPKTAKAPKPKDREHNSDKSLEVITSAGDDILGEGSIAKERTNKKILDYDKEPHKGVSEEIYFHPSDIIHCTHSSEDQVTPKTITHPESEEKKQHFEPPKHSKEVSETISRPSHDNGAKTCLKYPADKDEKDLTAWNPRKADDNEDLKTLTHTDEGHSLLKEESTLEMKPSSDLKEHEPTRKLEPSLRGILDIA